MTAIQHTPGPWKYKKCPCGDPICTRYRIHQADSAGMFSIDDAVLITTAPDLLEACRAQHDAIDLLCAMLIKLTHEHTPDDQFMPSKVKRVWDACVAGNEAIKKATQL